jgi:hypothetical protein
MFAAVDMTQSQSLKMDSVDSAGIVRVAEGNAINTIQSRVTQGVTQIHI